MSQAQVRPTGVTAVAVLAVVARVADIAAGLGNIGIGGGFLTNVGFGTALDGIMNIVGLALVLVGVLGLVTGIGLWRERGSAWQSARLFAVLCVLVGVVSAGLSLFGTTLTSGIVAAVLAAIVPAVAALVMLWYVYQPGVKAAFGRT